MKTDLSLSGRERLSPSISLLPSHGTFGYAARAPQVVNTSKTRLRVDWIPGEALPGASGRLGLTLCPGRYGSGRLEFFERDLSLDLATLAEDGVTRLCPLIEEFEFKTLRVPRYFTEAAEKGLNVSWFPIIDGSIPSNVDSFDAYVRRMVERVKNGEHLIFHCRAGLGRTGTLGSCTLLHFGHSPEEAIKITRASRQGTLEPYVQEPFVYRYARRLAVG